MAVFGSKERIWKIWKIAFLRFSLPQTSITFIFSTVKAKMNENLVSHDFSLSEGKNKHFTIFFSFSQSCCHPECYCYSAYQSVAPVPCTASFCTVECVVNRPVAVGVLTWKLWIQSVPLLFILFQKTIPVIVKVLVKKLSWRWSALFPPWPPFPFIIFWRVDRIRFNLIYANHAWQARCAVAFKRRPIEALLKYGPQIWSSSSYRWLFLWLYSIFSLFHSLPSTQFD